MTEREMRYATPPDIRKLMDRDWRKAGPKEVIGTLQILGERAVQIATNDRHPNRAADVIFLGELIGRIGIEARSRWKA